MLFPHNHTHDSTDTIRSVMANITTIPDEIIELILQSIYDDNELKGWDRDSAFLKIVQVLPDWIPILLDSCFFNDIGQRTTRYEYVWGYRQRVYLDQKSGTWQVRGQTWQPRGAKITGWKCRNGETSHVEVDEEVVTPVKLPSNLNLEDREGINERESGRGTSLRSKQRRKKLGSARVIN